MPISITIDPSVNRYLVNHEMDTDVLDAMLTVIRYWSTQTRAYYDATMFQSDRATMCVMFEDTHTPSRKKGTGFQLLGLPRALALARFAAHVKSIFTH